MPDFYILLIGEVIFFRKIFRRLGIDHTNHKNSLILIMEPPPPDDLSEPILHPKMCIF